MRWLHGAQGSNSLMTVPPGQTFLCAPGHAPYTAPPPPLRQYHLPRSTHGQLPSKPIRPRRTSQDHLRPIDWYQLEPPGTIPHESKPTLDEWLLVKPASSSIPSQLPLNSSKSHDCSKTSPSQHHCTGDQLPQHPPNAFQARTSPHTRLMQAGVSYSLDGSSILYLRTV